MILVVLVAIGYWFISSTISDRRKEKIKQELKDEKQLQVEKSITDIATKYNAVTDWKQRIGKKSYGEHTYTIEVEDALIRTDGRPILFTYPIYDIIRESDKYLVYFSAGSLMAAMLYDIKFDLDFFTLSCDIRFVLDCTTGQVKQIMNHPKGPFAVIAQISKVEKVRFKLKTYGDSYENVNVDLETTDVFMAKGQCLDLLFVGN